MSGNLIAYRLSASRSGKTPSEILACTKGTLVVDMYSGYTHITTVGGRERAACLAHARRKFFEAQESAAEAEFALKAIRDVYLVEHEIKARHLEQTETHLNARNELSRPLMVKLRGWLSDQEGLHPPKSLMGRAIAYCDKNWTELTRFMDDAKIPPDNNASEAALRAVALGRKNFLFVGNEEAGEPSPACTRSSPPARRTRSTPSNTCRTCCSARRNTRLHASTMLLPDQWKRIRFTAPCSDCELTRTSSAA